jgi:hypothetical protein
MQVELAWRQVPHQISARKLAVISMELIYVNLHLFVGYLDCPVQDHIPLGEENHAEGGEKGS